MHAYWVAVCLSLLCLTAVPANALNVQARADPRQLLWPNSDQEQQYKHAIIEWQKGQMGKYGARKGPVCYAGCCGLGHRNLRTLAQALHAWGHGQPLSIEWPQCNGVNSWTLVQDDQVLRDKYNHWISLGADKSLCQVNTSNEPYFDPPEVSNEGEELIPIFRGEKGNLQQHPVAKWYYVIQNIGVNYSPLGGIIARYLQTEFQGRVVISVHLRLGNGEEGAILDDRVPKIPRKDVFKYVSQTADRIAEEVLNVSAKNIRLFVASDTHAALEEFQRFDSRVFFFSGGTWVQQNAGVPSQHITDDDECTELEHTVMLESTLLGYADVLLTPQASLFPVIGRNLVMSRGGHWCDNQYWMRKSGEIPDPSTIDVDKTAVRIHDKQDDEDAASAMHEWEEILNCPSEKCSLGYKCYYEKSGLQSRVITW